MSATTPLPTADLIPLSEIPSALRELAWHRTQHEAVCAQRDQLVEDCARAQKAWRAEFDANRVLREEKRKLEQHVRDLEAERNALRRVQTPEHFEARIRRLSAESADYRNTIEELLANDAVGEACPSCGGWDDRRDEATSCEECFGGRVPR